MPTVNEPANHRGYIITYDPPPIPDRRYDWHFQHEQFCGDEDERYGDAASLADCIREIDFRLEDAAETRRG